MPDKIFRFTRITPYIAITAMILVAFWLFNKHNDQQQLSEIITKEQKLLDHVSEDIQFILRKAKDDVQFIANNQDVINTLSRKDISRSGAASSSLIEQFIKQYKIYLQVRILDKNGQELIRYNRRGADIYKVEKSSLQDKSDRDYFKSSINLSGEDVYVSGFDLNIENHVIEYPWQPVIRIAKPVYHNQQAIGIVVFNIDGYALFNLIYGILHTETHKIFITDNNGEWILAPDKEMNWNSVLKQHNSSIKTDMPGLWETLSTGNTGYSSENSIYTSNKISIKTASYDHSWHIISAISIPDGLKPLFIHFNEAILILASIVLFYLVIWRLHISKDHTSLAVEELSHTQNTMDAFMKHAPAAMYIKDKEGKFIQFNDKMLSMTNTANQTIINKTANDIFSSDIAAQHGINDEAILKTGTSISYEEIIHHGNQENYYLSTKFPIIDSDGSINEIGGISVDITPINQYQKKLQESEKRFKDLMESAPDAIVLVDEQGNIVDSNKQAEILFQYSKSELCTMVIEDLIEESLQDIHRKSREQYFSNSLKSYNNTRYDVETRQKDGTMVPVDISVSMLISDNRKYSVCILRDISDKKALDNQLRHSHKMEAIGKLTGGIAHDFNNILGIIIGNLEMAINLDVGMEKRVSFLNKCMNSALRAADLTKRLLAFSRKQSLSPQIVNINDSINELGEILHRTLGRNIDIVSNLQANIWNIHVDTVELENAIINLAINSRDAMPEGGKLFINTSNFITDKAESYTGSLAPTGEYIKIEISDTGCGISNNDINKIFEPFFTTKRKNEGTGLGLAMVYGFIKQSSGFIKVSSEPGKGTTFTILLPHYYSADEIARSKVQSPYTTNDLIGGTEKILLVDDEQDLLNISSTILTNLGYTVLTASSPDEALDIYQRNPGIDLLLTDVIMPGHMNGIQLAQALLKHQPGLKVIISSGFSKELHQDNIVLDFEHTRLNKPYMKNQLASTIRQVLDQSTHQNRHANG